MTGFSKSDFENDEVRGKLLSIINDKLHFDVLKPFSKLNKRQQVYFNDELNKYIQNLPLENYLDVITKDFNIVMSDILTSEDFRPELQRVTRSSTNPISVGKEELVDDVLTRLESISV
jgi:hypothetical protein